MFANLNRTLTSLAAKRIFNGSQCCFQTSRITFSKQESPKVLKEDIRTIGWLQFIRKQKKLTFLSLLDGSNSGVLQIVADSEMCSDLTQGSCVEVRGAMVTSLGRGQAVELRASSVTLLGSCDETCPVGGYNGARPELARHGALHLRHRQPEYAAMMRLRAGVKRQLREIMMNRGYLEVDTPVLTSADCEGAGETMDVANREFFDGVPVHLTVSGQLHLEAAVLGLGKVYSLAPTFRADKSRSRHHLSEFHMLEVESVYLSSLEDLCDEIESTTKTLIAAVTSSTSHLHSDLQLVNKNLSDIATSNPMKQSPELVDRILNENFVRLRFSAALEILARNDLVKPSEEQVVDLNRVQEQFLTDVHCQGRPVLLTNFPVEGKPFYCLQEEDGSAAAVDLLFPGVGEVAGGTVREHRLSHLTERMHAQGGEQFTASLDWYLQLREFGGAPHGGYGLGLDRVLQWITGIPNIKDVVTFPRYYHSCLL